MAKRRKFGKILHYHWTWIGTKMVAKKSYDTKDDADLWLEEHNQKMKYKSYLCPECNKWHIGSKIKKK